jgi:uncharacterized membrane protein YqjE
VVATLVAMAHTRLELFASELQEEIQRASSLLLWAFIALFTAGIGLFLLALVIIFAFWDNHRVLASILVTLFFFMLAGFAVWRLRTQLKSHTRLLDATLTELERDGERLAQSMKRSG